jgi:hypothetical protein
MDMTRLFRLAALGFLAITAARPAEACSCAMRSVCSAFWEVELVFVGRAEVTQLGPGAQRARFRVEERFRGPAADVVEIVGRGIGGSCAYAFGHGTRYLVFARRAPDGTWNAYFCDPTGPVDSAAAGLAFARDIARNPSRGGRIDGAVIVDPKPDSSEETPVAGGTVTLRGEGRVFSTRTDRNGSYSFDDVPVGRYVLTVSGGPGVQAESVVEIKGPGACVFNTVRVARTRR